MSGCCTPESSPRNRFFQRFSGVAGFSTSVTPVITYLADPGSNGDASADPNLYPLPAPTTFTQLAVNLHEELTGSGVELAVALVRRAGGAGPDIVVTGFTAVFVAGAFDQGVQILTPQPVTIAAGDTYDLRVTCTGIVDAVPLTLSAALSARL